MSFLIGRGPLASSVLRRTATQAWSTTTLKLSTTRGYALKESDRHVDGAGEKAEAAKQEHLKKQREGKGEWDSELASDSESAVKADKGLSGDPIADLRKAAKETK